MVRMWVQVPLQDTWSDPKMEWKFMKASLYRRIWANTAYKQVYFSLYVAKTFATIWSFLVHEMDFLKSILPNSVLAEEAQPNILSNDRASSILYQQRSSSSPHPTVLKKASLNSLSDALMLAINAPISDRDPSSASTNIGRDVWKRPVSVCC